MNLFDLNTSPDEFNAYLRQVGLTAKGEHVIAIEKPGEGNMNVVIRIKTNITSLIFKQSREFVQKYPQIPAPMNRISVEYSFYNALSATSAASFFPKIRHFDEENYALILEDLGQVQDLSRLYSTREVNTPNLKDLVHILSEIHLAKPPQNQPKNLELRKLNHQHIFILPFVLDNGFDLDSIQEGLQKLAEPIKNDENLKQRVHEIGELYLSEGNTLLHGDYYPGSWMKIDNKIYVLDPEFSFLGFAEFDLGVMAAHLILSTGKIESVEGILNEYQGKVSYQLTCQMAGIEIIRRLIGLAQLPLERTLEEKEHLLQMAKKLVLS